MEESCDIAIIGAGPGGYMSAIKAAQSGARVTLVDKSKAGGVCLHYGCIPTKAMLEAAEVYRVLPEMRRRGININSYGFDYPIIINHAYDIVSKLQKGLEHLLAKYNIRFINGEARFNKDGALSIDGKEIKAHNTIIATGARPKVLWNAAKTYIDVLQDRKFPLSVVIIGGGAIGVEFASFYSALGSQVSILEIKSSILHLEDREVSVAMSKALSEVGVNIITNIKIIDIKQCNDCVVVSYDIDGHINHIKAESVISAIGITPNTENIGLENIGIKLDNGFIKVNEQFETNIPRIFAIGDVIGGLCNAHKAYRDATAVIEYIKSGKQKTYAKYIPYCIYSFPQVACIGLTEENAKADGYNISVGKFPFAANAKAAISGQKTGFIKTIFCADSEQILGVHMVGPSVSEMIHSASIMMNNGIKSSTVLTAVFPHPSLSEAFFESMLGAYGHYLHI